MTSTGSTVVYPVAGQYDSNGQLQYDTVVPAVPVADVERERALDQRENALALEEQKRQQERLAAERAERERLALAEAERERAPIEAGKHDSIAERLVKKVAGKA